jgi:hypothetical protein
VQGQTAATKVDEEATVREMVAAVPKRREPLSESARPAAMTFLSESIRAQGQAAPDEVEVMAQSFDASDVARCLVTLEPTA